MKNRAVKKMTTVHVTVNIAHAELVTRTSEL
jgi:hypothetical protein